MRILKNSPLAFILTMILAVSVAAGDTSDPPRPDEGPVQSPPAVTVPGADEAKTSSDGMWETLVEAMRLVVALSLTTKP